MGEVPEDSLEALAARAADGERAAFDRLARRIYPKLARWALAKTGRPDDADEVVQRALVGMHRGLSTFRGESRLTTWAYRIAQNAWLDLERSRARRARREEPLMEAIEAVTAWAAPGPDERLGHLESAQLARAFFTRLPARQREVMELVDLQGLEPSEAADILGVSASTARVHLHRARRTLREAIRKHHPEIAEEYEA